MNLSAAIDNNILKFSYPRHHNTNSESAAPSHRPRVPMQSIPRAVHAHSTSTGSATSDMTVSTPDVANPSGHFRNGSASISMSKMFSSNPFKHARNHSNQCLTTMSPQDVIARILAQDEIPRGTFLASEREKDLAKNGVNGGCAGGLARRYPERLDSRRALLSMANGAKAPIVLRGPSPMRGSPCNARKEQTVNCQVEASSDPSVPAPPVPTVYAHKQLPPTPRLSILSNVELSPSSALIAMYACTLSPTQDDVCKLSSVPEKKTAIPQTKPLNLGLARPTITTTVTSTTETKRFSRMLQTAVPAKVVKRRTNVPAPIRPPHFRGPRAFNAPLSATSSESSEDEESFLALDFPLPPQTRQDKTISASKERHPSLTDKVVVVTAAEPTPMGDLSITPLDIPVDWDDLHDRWTSPVINLHQDAMLASLLSETMDLPLPEAAVESDQEDSEVLLAFQDDVASLFARSPTLDVRTLDLGEEEEEMDRHPEPSLPGAAPLIPCEPEEAEEADPCGPIGREKRHGRVLVTKEIKLCLDVDLAQAMRVEEDQEPKERRRRQSEVYVAGESFLMMASPLSPESMAGSRRSYLW